MMTGATRSIRTFEQFRDTMYAFRLSRILFSALELDLFNNMGVQDWTVSRLARRVRVSQRGLSILCRNLASVNLLFKSSLGYKISPFSQKYLLQSSPDFQADYLALMRRQWGEWSHLTEVIRSGHPLDNQKPESPEYRKSFTWAMHHRSRQPARDVAEQVPLKKVQKLLDLGGGPGTYALEFLRHNPQLHATLIDRRMALKVAKTLARQSPWGTRLSFQPGDFLREPIAGLYDVVWYSNVLHIYSPRENLRIFRKIKRILKPGGRLLIQDTFLSDPKGLSPLETNLFAVSMLLYTDKGNTYSLHDVREWLHQTGLAPSRVIQLKKGTGDWEGRLIEGRHSQKKMILL